MFLSKNFLPGHSLISLQPFDANNKIKDWLTRARLKEKKALKI